MMTHDEMIAVIAAHRDGKKIQFRRRRMEGSTWARAVDPVWNFDEYDYRAEPEPIEAWVVVRNDGEKIGAFLNKDRAGRVSIERKGSRIVRMIEAEEGGEA